MYPQCIVIISLFLLIIFLSIRRKKAYMAFLVLPLTVTPLFHLMAIPVHTLINTVVTVKDAYIIVACNFLGFCITGLSLGLSGKRIKTKKFRLYYISTCIIYSFILTLILVFNTVTILGK